MAPPMALDEERGIYTALGKIGGDTASSLELCSRPGGDR